MAKDTQTIYNEIVAHINSQGSSSPNWYCGITSDIDSRLFGDHKVPRKDAWFIYRTCANDTDARAVETTLVKLGCDGGSGGGDQTSVIVYAYLKTAVTDP